MPHPKVAPRAKDDALFPEESEPPRSYGYWSCDTNKNFDERPKALILFSGKARTGDLHQTLVSLGWRVCSIDLLAPKPTDILDEGVWTLVLQDLAKGFYEALWVATPCETFSPLRGQGPGPRPLRSVQRITGLPKEELKPAEVKQLKESNLLVGRSAAAIGTFKNKKKPWGMENPKHQEDQVSIWKMPQIEHLTGRPEVKSLDFDQCKVGQETKKPTRIIYQNMNLSELEGLVCDHPPVEQKDAKGKTYFAPHPSPAGRWRFNSDGTRERASKALGEYPYEMNYILAKAFHETQTGAKWLSSELATEDIP